MEILIDRFFKGPLYTIGKMYIDGKYECDTLEDIDRGLKLTDPLAIIQSKKVYGLTAIPTGTYKITMNIVSPKFKDRAWAKFCSGKLPRLLEVPGFEGVLIHVGNTDLDSLGCILVGKNTIKGRLTESTITFLSLYKKLLAAKSITLTIK